AGSQGCGGSLAVGQWDPLRISLHLHNVRVYEILNAIVAQNGRAIWTVTASNLATRVHRATTLAELADDAEPKSLLVGANGAWHIAYVQRGFNNSIGFRR